MIPSELPRSLWLNQASRRLEFRIALLTRLVLICALAALIATSVLGADTGANAAVLSRFIKAVERRDFRLALEATHACRRDVASIKRSNPTVLWKQLIEEYYGRKVQALTQTQGSWQQYVESLAAATGDPIAFLRSASALLPAGTKWSITETRTESVPDSIESGPYTRITTFVTVDYPDAGTAPSVENRALRHTILEFVAQAKTGGIIAIQRLAKADKFWPVPTLSQMQASEITQEFLKGKVNAFIQPRVLGTVGVAGDRWLAVPLPNYESPAVAEYQHLFRNAGFKLRSWEIRPGWGANSGEVSPPDSWGRYELRNNNENPRFSLEEDVQISITKVEQNQAAALVTAHIKRNGCNEVCSLLAAYWSSAVSQQITDGPGAHDMSFFMTHWEGDTNSNGAAALTLPEVDDRLVSLQWQPGAGWVALKQETLTAPQPRRILDLAPVALEIGVAKYPAGLVDGSMLYQEFRTAMADAGYAIEKDDPTTRSLRSFSRYSRGSETHGHSSKGTKMIKDPQGDIRCLWTVDIASSSDGSVSARLGRGCSLGRVPDIPALFRYVAGELKLDAARIALSMDGNTAALNAWK